MIYFVRHGSTDWSEQKKVQGRADIPMNEKGVAQARALASQVNGLIIDNVFCSPMSRTKETLENIYNGSAITIYDERLLERDYGEFEGKTYDEFDFIGFWSTKKPQAFQTAESLYDAQQRVYSFINELRAESNKDYLIVSHQGVGRFFNSYFYGAPKDGEYARILIPSNELLVFDFNNCVGPPESKQLYDYSDIIKQEPELLTIKSVEDKEARKAEKRAKRRHFFLNISESTKSKDGDTNIDKMFRGFFDCFDMLFGIIGLATEKSSFPSSSLKKNKKQEQGIDI
jgi:broad specificity phosphatase PhoE